MFTISYALFPIFSLIVLGQIFRKFQFPGDAFWPLAARLTYFVLFPALLTRTVAIAQLQDLDIMPMVGTLVAAVIGVSALAIVSKPLLPVNNPAFTSLFQGSIRHNTYVGLAAAAALLGEVGLTLAAVALITLVPLVNLLSVVVLTRFADKQSTNPRQMISPIITNPLIIACVVGGVLNVTGIGLPFIFNEILGLLSRAALPIGLLVVGAGLEIGLLRYAFSPIIIASSLKLIIFPILTAAICTTMGLANDVKTIFVVFTALPCAPSAYVLALEMRGDARLMAAIITGETILAVISMPLMIIWLG